MRVDLQYDNWIFKKRAEFLSFNVYILSALEAKALVHPQVTGRDKKKAQKQSVYIAPIGALIS